jgi:eukaryotic-like serine/threonine-protein kinase
MSPPSHARLGPYEVLGLLGAGGMGEVYRGRDPRLGRQVAIKVLPPGLSADPDRLHRFEQEARSAAALNHPNIVAVYDIGQYNGSPYIVSELLEGETLRARLEGGSPAARQADGSSGPQRPLPVRRAVDYAVQIAQGLAAAHDKGIIHRDLKPENIFLVSDGHAKILDFGLAKLVQPSLEAVGNSTTIARDTQPGVVLGTVGYMSPEQVRGQLADHRSDIFAFGAILYEMLTGQRAFRGASSADTMTAILTEDPPALPGAGQHIPPGVGRVVDRCLDKNPHARFQSAHDLAFALEGLSTRSDTTAAVRASTRRWPSWLPWGLFAATALALVATSALAISYSRRAGERPRSVRFTLDPPGTLVTSARGTSIAVSPDGNRIAFAATAATGSPVLWVRDLGSVVAQQFPGTDGAVLPFWSPDGRSIGFYADARLKKIAVSGGPPQTLGYANLPTAGAWNRDGVILVSGQTGPIGRTSTAGGEMTAASTLDQSRQEVAHLFPHFLPDGRRFLFYARSTTPEHDGIYVKALDSDDVQRVVDARSNVAYVAPGYLVYAREGILVAQPFDVDRAVTTGDPIPIAERVEQSAESGLAVFAASETGVLVYRGSTDTARSRLIWFDRRGNRLGAIGEPGTYRNPRLSPDGTRVAVEMVDPSGNRDIWLIDVVRGVPTRFTFDASRDAAPVWSSDGRQIVWQGGAHTYLKSSSGTGREESLKNEPWIPDDWLPDGSGLLFHPNAPRQVWFLPLTGADRTPRPRIEGRAITSHARLSPDGHWVAFSTNDSGRFEINLQNFQTPAGTWRLSANGGIQPKWRHDGRELFYLALDGTLMSVPVTLGALPEIGRARPLFQTRIEPATGFVWHQYDVTPDGRFLVNVPEAEASPVTVVVDWPALMKR